MKEKMILLIDKPKCCSCCPLAVDYLCCGTGDEISNDDYGYIGLEEDLTVRPDWCPLKPMPNDYPPYEKTRNQNFYTEEEFDAYEKGWNDCLEEIEK